MTSIWQTHQARLAAILAEQPGRAPNWTTRRRGVSATHAVAAGWEGYGSPGSPTMRLPGVWRPECGPLVVRAR